MAPVRPLKRQKTNPDDRPPQTEAPKPEQIPLPPDTPAKQPVSTTDASVKLDEPKRNSWYPSWSRKTAPIAITNRQSVTSLHDETASVLSDHSTRRRPSTRSASLAMTLGKGNSSRSLPVDASTSRVHATSGARRPSLTTSKQVEGDSGKSMEDNDRVIPSESTEAKPEVNQPSSGGTEGEQKQAAAGNRESRQSGWFGWLAKDEPPQTDQQTKPSDMKGKSADTNTDVTAQAATKAEVVKPNAETPSEPTPVNSNATTSAPLPNGTQKRTWLQMLGGDNPTKLSNSPPAASSSAGVTADAGQQSKGLDIPQTPLKTQSQASSIETSPPPPLPGDASKSAGWVFWSRDKKQQSSVPVAAGDPHEGEIAISGTPSQNRPKRASISVPEDARPAPKDLKTTVSKAADKAGSVRSVERPQTPIESKPQKSTEQKPAKKIESKNAAAVALEQPSPRPSSPAPSKRTAENLLLPAFHDTLHLHQSPTLLEQLRRLLYYTKEPELKHLELVKEPPRLKSALAIGVHGYFPGAMVRTLLGQPTGTSIKFADMAAKAIRNWTNSRGYDCQVKTAALEGEGKIAERVELLWKLLLNWIDEIRKTDFVMVACHSQGVPVAVMLVAKLIQFGCVNPARVGICAMAGVSMGPFAEYKSRWISGSAGELFEFSDPNSKVSGMYQEAVDTILKAGVRWTLVGSIDDQLVSLESSIFAPITHPHIYRAVLIDSRIHAPGFLSHLVGFVLKLRNMGVQDHGLIRELSSPLAGSLYTGEGHSRIYEDELVYDLAVSFALETNARHGVDVTRRNIQSAGGNPYILPFAMRGILEEEFVRSELREEVNQLLQQFDDWKPSTKALKDVKFRLEGIRSKL